MILLALESSGLSCSVALCHDAAVFHRRGDDRQSHSEVMLDLIREVLSEAGLKLHDLEAVAFGVGPGAFTGLRLACAMAQGLAMGLDIPVLPVSTLQTLAHCASHDRVIAVMDARMNQVYLAAYERVGTDLLTRIAPCLCDPDQLPALSGSVWLPLGSGAEQYEAELACAWPGQLLPVEKGRVPDARSLLELALREFELQRFVDPEMATPLYLRDKVALTRNERDR